MYNQFALFSIDISHILMLKCPRVVTIMECDVIRFKKGKFLDLYPIQLGWQKHRPNKSFYYSSKRDYLIHYIVSGKGKAIINSEEFSLEKDQYFLVKKGDKVSYIADGETPWHYIWISFDGEFAKNFNLIKSTGNISPEIFMNLMSAFDKKDYKEEYIISQIYLLYIQMKNVDSIKTLPEKIKDYIDNNIEKKLLVDDIAATFNISRKYLTKVFSEKFNISTKKYITHIKMKKALTMLKNGATVKFTAEHLSYDDPFTFSKAFKRETGYPPKSLKNGMVDE